jgi:hypothetical protein
VYSRFDERIADKKLILAVVEAKEESQFDCAADLPGSVNPPAIAIAVLVLSHIPLLTDGVAGVQTLS